VKKELGSNHQPEFPDQQFIPPTRSQEVKDYLLTLALLGTFSALYYQVAMLAIETYLAH